MQGEKAYNIPIVLCYIRIY